MANTCDYDIVFEETQYAFNDSLEGYLIDMTDQLPYTDLDAPWWWSDFMKENSINTDKLYYLNGDLTLSALMGASAFYVNKDIFIDYFGPMDTLYDDVRNKTWTVDDVLHYASTVYTDNGNGVVDIDDIMGLRYEKYEMIDYWTVSNGIFYVDRDLQGYPVLDLDKEIVYTWCEKLYALCFEDNRAQYIEGVMPEAEAFKLGKTLFQAGLLSDAAKYKEVDFDYGILPHPVLVEGYDYVSAAATVNGASVVLPITVDMSKIDVISATLEALCSYAYRKVAPIYLESTLKYKYSNDVPDSEMVELIYNTVAGSFLMITDQSSATFGSTGSFFVKAVLLPKSPSFASYWASHGPALEANFDSLTEMYKNGGKPNA